MDTNSDDQMSPAASPGEKSGRSGVRRVNNMPVYIVIIGLGIFLLIMAVVAADRAEKQNRPEAAGEVAKGGDTSKFAQELAGNQTDGMIQASAAVPPPVPDLASASVPAAIARPIDLESPPIPPTSQQQLQQPAVTSIRDGEADRMRMMKLQQLDEAVKARTSLPVVAPRSTGSSLTTGPTGMQSPPASRDEALARLAEVRRQIEESTRDDPAAAYKDRLQRVQTSLSGGQGTDAPKPDEGTPHSTDIARAAGSEQGDRWRLDAQPVPPRTPYSLRTGFVLPATLISGVNSELPGQIMAQVSQDVYDTPLGRYKLIPQGARLVGSYSSEVAYGQSRIFVAWHRIIFPDGKAMDIGAMPGADSAGYAGFNDKVNNHFFRLFSSAFLMSGVTAGIALSQRENGSTNARPTASSAISEALGQQLGQVTAQMIARNLNIAPTLEIRPGYRFNVIVVKDMTFSKPYAAFDY